MITRQEDSKGSLNYLWHVMRTSRHWTTSHAVRTFSSCLFLKRQCTVNTFKTTSSISVQTYHRAYSGLVSHGCFLTIYSLVHVKFLHTWDIYWVSKPHVHDYNSSSKIWSPHCGDYEDGCRPGDGNSKHVWHVGKLLPDHKVQEPSRQTSSVLIIMFLIIYNVFWNVKESCFFHYSPDDGGSMFLWNDGQYQNALCIIVEDSLPHTFRENLEEFSSCC